MIVLIGAIAMIVCLLGLTLFVARSAHPVAVHQALVINRMDRTDVMFTTTLVMPIVHKAELIDLRLVPLSFERKGRDGLICRDHLRADLEVVCVIAIGATGDDILQVVQSIGCERASDPDTLRSLFAATVGEALKKRARDMDYDRLVQDQGWFVSSVIEEIGTLHAGYVLEDMSIASIRPHPYRGLRPEQHSRRKRSRGAEETGSVPNVNHFFSFLYSLPVWL